MLHDICAGFNTIGPESRLDWVTYTATQCLGLPNQSRRTKVVSTQIGSRSNMSVVALRFVVVVEVEKEAVHLKVPPCAW